METADKIRAYRESAHLTLKALGERCGMSAAHINKYECGGRNAKLTAIYKIAKGLGIRPVNLLPDWFLNSDWKLQPEPKKRPEITEQAIEALNRMGEKVHGGCDG